MLWKVYVITYGSIATPGGARSASSAEIQAAHDAIRHTFAQAVAAYTYNRVTVEATFAPTVGTLTPKKPYGESWWPTTDETRAELDQVPWCAYDSIFVVAPFQGMAGGFAAWGEYWPDSARGATYAAFPSSLSLSDCNGDWIVHEFLHGACRFYQRQGYPMPQSASAAPGSAPEDGVHVGGEYYPELASTCFSNFYRDLMRGESRPGSTWSPPVSMGIPLTAWELGTPRNVDALAGRTSSDPAGFRAAFRDLAPAWPINGPGRADSQAFAADGGERQHYGTPSGEAALVKGSGQSVFALPPRTWSAVSRGGGVPVMGYPIAAPRTWGNGIIQDFRKGTAASGLMQAPGRDWYAVPPKVFAALTAAGGAPVLGYPVNDLHGWGDGQLQDFSGPGGASAVMQGSGRDAHAVLQQLWGAFLGGGGAPVMGYPVNALHTWGEGKTQDFSGPGGTCAMMQGTGRSAHAVLPRIWQAYVQNSGAPGLGYPTNGLHDWGAGKIQDFELASGWHCGAMLATGASQAFVLKGLIWKHYVSRGGAASYLGYPVTDEYSAQMGGRWYWMQTFAGGKIRIDQQTSVAEDYR